MKEIIKKLWSVRKKNKNKIFSQIIQQSGGITLLDLGAAGEIEPRWRSLTKNLNYIGFEADDRSFSKLSNSKNCNSYTILNTFAWNDKRDLKFYLCEDPQVSSSFEPNKNFLNRFQNSKRFEIKKIENFYTSTIDSELINTSIDFAKLDIQGAELSALKGMVTKLPDCLGLEIEVEFTSLYKNQPLFGDINSFLTDQGFEFFDFTNLCRWERSEFNPYGQCVFGDGLWLRSPEHIAKNNKNKHLKYIAICAIYGRYDLIKCLIEIMKIDLKKEYKQNLNKLVKIQKRNRRINNFLSNFIKFISAEDTTRSYLIY